MLNGKTVAVVIPAYNEASQVKMVLESIPDFVDRVVVVDDASKDSTVEIVKRYMDGNTGKATAVGSMEEPLASNLYNKAELVAKEILSKEENRYTPHTIYPKDESSTRTVLIRHKHNAHVGAAIATGYKWCRDHKIFCTAVLAGDGQMDPDELINICSPVVYEDIDYVKANRLSHRSALFVVPKLRFFGNSVLSLLTKIASGYWHISDTQTGFTAISLRALEAIRIHKIYKSYGVPNDILVKLNIAFCTVKEVPSKPVYHIGERSKMNELKVVPRIGWLLFKSFWVRLYSKYLFRDFHPLFLLYHLGIVLLLIDIPYIIQATTSVVPGEFLPLPNMLIFTFLTISGLQTLFFAMWMDMMDNERLQK